MRKLQGDSRMSASLMSSSKKEPRITRKMIRASLGPFWSTTTAVFTRTVRLLSADANSKKEVVNILETQWLPSELASEYLWHGRGADAGVVINGLHEAVKVQLWYFNPCELRWLMQRVSPRNASALGISFMRHLD
ncbi:MAG: hypothetical protein ACLRS8_14745 [Parabacteroides merdae]